MLSMDPGTALGERRSLRRMPCVVALFLLSLESPLQAQAAPGSDTAGVMLVGVVVDAQGEPVVGASVVVQAQADATTQSASTDASGKFSIAALHPGTYTYRTTGSAPSEAERVVLSAAATQQLRIVVHGQAPVKNAPPLAGQAMEFSDKPNFSVAGVSDWTAVGGHGSDAVLRTSEALTRDTAALEAPPSGAARLETQRPPDKGIETKLLLAVHARPADYKANDELGRYYLRTRQYEQAMPPLLQAAKLSGDASDTVYTLALAYQGVTRYREARELVGHALVQQDKGEYEHLAGQLDEQLGDALSSVRHLERAMQLDGSEQNYFDLGSELLLHRAIWLAVQTFASGSKAYPKSVRMRTAWGAALFAGALYEQSAQRLCEASDLDPRDLDPYRFIGQLAVVSPQNGSCVRQSLERFLRLAPQNAQASYYLAMSLKQSGDPESMQRSQELLKHAVLLEPNYAEAHVQLGITAFAQHHYPESITEYKKAVTADPTLGEAHYRLAVAYDRTGKTDLARVEFDLHDQLEKAQAEAVEQQRRHITQFVMASRPEGDGPPKH